MLGGKRAQDLRKHPGGAGFHTADGHCAAEDFYAWGVQAREKKKNCDQGNISLEEYQDWLKHS